MLCQTRVKEKTDFFNWFLKGEKQEEPRIGPESKLNKSNFNSYFISNFWCWLPLTTCWLSGIKEDIATVEGHLNLYQKKMLLFRPNILVRKQIWFKSDILENKTKLFLGGELVTQMISVWIVTGTKVFVRKRSCKKKEVFSSIYIPS